MQSKWNICNRIRKLVAFITTKYDKEEDKLSMIGGVKNGCR